MDQIDGQEGEGQEVEAPEGEPAAPQAGQVPLQEEIPIT